MLIALTSTGNLDRERSSFPPHGPSTSVDAVATWTECEQQHHAAEDRHVLHEVDLLCRQLLRRRRPEVVEDRCDDDQEDDERERGPARLPAEQYRHTCADLDQDRDRREHLRHRQAFAGDITHGARESDDFPVSGKDEHTREQNAAKQRRPVLLYICVRLAVCGDVNVSVVGIHVIHLLVRVGRTTTLRRRLRRRGRSSYPHDRTSLIWFPVRLDRSSRHQRSVAPSSIWFLGALRLSPR